MNQQVKIADILGNSENRRKHEGNNGLLTLRITLPFGRKRKTTMFFEELHTLF